MMSRTGRRKTQAGFLLVEVLAAFLVLSVGVLAAFHCLGRCLAAARRAGVMDAVSSDAKETLFELETRSSGGRPLFTLDSWSGDLKELHALR